MSQPDWKCIGQLGDVNPVEHGGFWVLQDKTGVYCEEAEYLDEEGEGLAAYRFILDRCTYVEGVLSDNKHHPEHPAWFADDLPKVAECCDTTWQELVYKLCSADPLERAAAYRDLISYNGAVNFDQYPLYLSQSEARRRYKAWKYQVCDS